MNLTHFKRIRLIKQWKNRNNVDHINNESFIILSCTSMHSDLVCDYIHTYILCKIMSIEVVKITLSIFQLLVTYIILYTHFVHYRFTSIIYLFSLLLYC